MPASASTTTLYAKDHVTWKSEGEQPEKHGGLERRGRGRNQQLVRQSPSVRLMNHFGFMRPKSVRRFVRNDRLESRTMAPPGPRQNTAQCHTARPHSMRHFSASNARSGNASQHLNGSSLLETPRPYSRRSNRTETVSDQSRGSSAKMPSRRAVDCACLYVTPASAATQAIPQPVSSFCMTGL